jgi:hypothetical protein
MRWPIVVAIFAAGSVRAEPSRQGLAVLAFGPCDEALLPDAARSLRREVDARAPGTVLSEERLAAPGGGLSRLSLEEVRRAIESGKSDFLNLNVEKAEETLRNVLPDIDRLPLGPQRWEAFASARANLARLLLYKGQRAQATSVFMDVLRVQEDFTLSRTEFPPSMRDFLEQTRSLVPGLPRFALKIASEVAFAKVYLNGYGIGATPFDRAIPSGTYQVVVGEPGRHSFVRSLAMASDVSLTIDVAKESRLKVARGPCFETGPARAERLAVAPMVAAAFGADRIIQVGLERLSDGEYVTAALVDVARGQEVRAGRDRLVGGVLPLLHKLADLVLTGKPIPVEPEKKAEEKKIEPPRTEPRAVEAPRPPPSPTTQEIAPQPAVALAPKAPVEQTQEQNPSRWTLSRIAAFGLAGVALGLGGVSLVQHFKADAAQRELEVLVVPGSGGSVRPEDAPRAKELADTVDQATTQRALLGAGAAVAAIGSGAMFFISYSGGSADTDRPASKAVAVALAGRF